MYERNQFIVFQTIFHDVSDFQKIFDKNEKLSLNYHICMVQPLVLLIFSKNFFKEMSFRNVIENRLQDNKLISFVHLWFYFADINTVCSFLKISCHNLYMVHISQEGRGDCYTDYFSFIIIIIEKYCIIVPLYRRKFCDGHIMPVSE